MACSKQYAIPNNVGSLYGPAIKENPTGNPCTTPIGTVICGYPAIAAGDENDRAGIERAIEVTRESDGVMSVPVSMKLSGKQITVSVAASNRPPVATHGEVWICSISKAVPISIGRGENRGREVTYYNVVRNVLKVGDWNGSAGSWTVPLENISHDGIDAAAVFVQDGSHDRPGPMLGAAYTALH